MKALVEPDGNEITGINDFQTSFLDLLNVHYPALLKNIQVILKDRFYKMYKNSDDEKERQYNPKEELVLHKIQVPSNSSDEWELMYEMKNE